MFTLSIDDNGEKNYIKRKRYRMDFNITTPTLLFSAISLWMLAFTNRFLAVAGLVRQFVAKYETDPQEGIRKQLQNFTLRLKLIKHTQLFGVLSFLLCVVCMLLVFTGSILVAELVFAGSLVALMGSLFFSFWEILISIGALNLELARLDQESRKKTSR